MTGLVATLGRRHFVVGGLVATLGEGHFCGGTGGYVGRMTFLWGDWWLRWDVGGLVAKLGEGHFEVGFVAT